MHLLDVCRRSCGDVYLTVPNACLRALRGSSQTFFVRGQAPGARSALPSPTAGRPTTSRRFSGSRATSPRSPGAMRSTGGLVDARTGFHMPVAHAACRPLSPQVPRREDVLERPPSGQVGSAHAPQRRGRRRRRVPSHKHIPLCHPHSLPCLSPPLTVPASSFFSGVCDAFEGVPQRFANVKYLFEMYLGALSDRVRGVCFPVCLQSACCPGLARSARFPLRQTTASRAVPTLVFVCGRRFAAAPDAHPPARSSSRDGEGSPERPGPSSRRRRRRRRRSGGGEYRGRGPGEVPPWRWGGRRCSPSGETVVRDPAVQDGRARGVPTQGVGVAGSQGRVRMLFHPPGAPTHSRADIYHSLLARWLHACSPATAEQQRNDSLSLLLFLPFAGSPATSAPSSTRAPSWRRCATSTWLCWATPSAARRERGERQQYGSDSLRVVFAPAVHCIPHHQAQLAPESVCASSF